MEVGLLWYDSNPKRGIDDKVLDAASRYREKHGRWPNVCYIHDGALNGGGEGVVRHAGGAIRVLTAPNMLLHHFWIGETQLEIEPGGSAR